MISLNLSCPARGGSLRTSVACEIAINVLIACCSGTVGAQSAAPAALVHDRTDESSLATVELSAGAEARLRIGVGKVEIRDLPMRTLRSAVVETPDAQHVRLVAPVAGSIAGEQTVPAVGQQVEFGEALVRLRLGEDSEGNPYGKSDRLVLLRARSDLEGQRVSADASVRQATALRDAARAAFERAVGLQKDAVGSIKAVEEARAALLVAEAEREGAVARAESLARAQVDLESASSDSIVEIRSPIAGVVTAVSIHPGDPIAAGATLIDLANRSEPWIRLSVYFTEYAALRGIMSASLVDRPGAEAGRRLRRLDLPTRADPVAGTVDLLFEPTGSGHDLVPGQRVLMRIGPDQGERRIVPYGALLYDHLGGAWVYEKLAPQTYRRRRVEVEDVVGDHALLGVGPAAGVEVVVAGAAELFGIEFGAGK